MGSFEAETIPDQREAFGFDHKRRAGVTYGRPTSPEVLREALPPRPASSHSPW